MRFFGKKEAATVEEKTKVNRFSLSEEARAFDLFLNNNAIAKTFQRKAIDDVRTHDGVAMDSSCIGDIKGFNFGTLSGELANWYAAQSFIGYQACALISQHWLVDKACTMPAEDAARGGFSINAVTESELPEDVIPEIEKLDRKFNLNQNLVEFERLSRIFGMRLAMFDITSNDPDYYKKPYNPDGIRPGSYKGIIQIEPYWCTPQLDTDSLASPASPMFYKPNYWLIGDKMVHHSHLIINQTCVVPDLLKSTYRYGGVPIPQRIYEKVYNAERTANEAPMLCMTKRTDVLKTDVGQAMANRAKFESNMRQYTEDRNNYGLKIIGLEDEMQRLDTTLAELDAVIMTQFQIVASAAWVPATKLLGIAPKGFNSTGEYDESSYHEHLESIQATHFTPLVQRHHEILVRSEIVPKFGVAPFVTEISWSPLDSPTEKERAEINLIKAQAGQILQADGAIDGSDERQRIMNDPDSGYTNISDDDEILPEESELLTPTELNEGLE